jgi:hypothetical protein
MKNKKSAAAVKALTEMDVAELRDAASIQNNIVDAAKARLADIQSELTTRFADVIKSALEDEGKTHGQHTFESEGVKLTSEVRATVKWDSPKLELVARSLPYDQVQRMFKIEFSVPEKSFQSVTDNTLKDKLLDARTVKYSEPKFTFVS